MRLNPKACYHPTMGKTVSLESLRGKRVQLRAQVEEARASLDEMLSELEEIEAAEKIVMRYGVDDGEEADDHSAARMARLPLNAPWPPMNRPDG